MNNMKIEEVSMVELSLFISGIGVVIIGFLKQLQASKCNKIKCLCFECERSPEFKSEEVEINNNNTIPNLNNIDRV
jgi:hypothetical protein